MIPVYFNPHSVWFISDAMAERGDLIGCTVLFEMAENGEVPISFTLNGKPITQARVSIRIFQEDSLLFPFVSMGHEGVAVSAKVSNICNLFFSQPKLSHFVWHHDDIFSTKLSDLDSRLSLFFASIVVDKGVNGKRKPDIEVANSTRQQTAFLRIWKNDWEPQIRQKLV